MHDRQNFCRQCLGLRHPLKILLLFFSWCHEAQQPMHIEKHELRTPLIHRSEFGLGSRTDWLLEGLETTSDKIKLTSAGWHCDRGSAGPNPGVSRSLPGRIRPKLSAVCGPIFFAAVLLRLGGQWSRSNASHNMTIEDYISPYLYLFLALNLSLSPLGLQHKRSFRWTTVPSRAQSKIKINMDKPPWSTDLYKPLYIV